MILIAFPHNYHISNLVFLKSPLVSFDALWVPWAFGTLHILVGFFARNASILSTVLAAFLTFSLPSSDEGLAVLPV